MKAIFTQRTQCIACESAKLRELASGRFNEGIVGQYIASDPWGEHPAPFLEGLPWSYVQCECGQCFHRYILNAEWNERRFSKWMTQEAIEAFEREYKTPQSMFEDGAAHAAHVLRIKHLGAQRVLDFGCGYGQFLAMCSLFGLEGVGVDRSSAKRGHGMFPILAELDEVQGTFDALTLFEVLEHLDEPRPLLERLSGFLRPGGVLILETPNCEGMTDIRSRDEYLNLHPLDHINGFTPTTMQAFAERLGFKRIAPPAAYVTSDWRKAVKQYVKRAGNFGKKRTQQYFVKVSGGASPELPTSGRAVLSVI